jgi:pimeloyl-ACP methyl ester carboxylesterase
MRRILKLLAVGALCGYVAVLALLYVKQRDLLYPRNPARAEIASANLPGVEEVMLTAADGEKLIAWVVPPREGKPVLLFFHGNAGNFAGSGRQSLFRQLTEDGTGLFAVNYRGYGGSSGSPTEDGLAQDARSGPCRCERTVRRGAAGRLWRVARHRRGGEAGGRDSAQGGDPAGTLYVHRLGGAATLSLCAGRWADEGTSSALTW